MKKKTIALLALLLLAQSAHAERVVIQSPHSYEDTRDQAEEAIIERGLVLTYHAYISDMLERTADVSGDPAPAFAHAEGFFFCQVSISHDLLHEDIHNIAHCPNGIYVYQGRDSDTVHVSYRRLDGDSDTIAKVNDLLEQIAQQAVE